MGAAIAMSAGLAGHLARFDGLELLVIGDMIADEYLFGRPTRISREAPVLILRFAEREFSLGGAANAAHNAAVLGSRVRAAGVVGTDAPGEEILAGFRAAGIPLAGVARDASRRTPIKTRIMAGGYQATRQQVVRLDREPEGELSPPAEAELLRTLDETLPSVDVVLLSDYGYGTLTPRVVARVLEERRRRRLVVAADSRYELARFVGVTAVTPNESELAEAAGVAVDDERSVDKAGRELLERLDAELLLVTRGSRGLALLERSGATTFFPVHGSEQIADVTGAGDTVITTFALALAAGAPARDAAALANVSGGVVVMKRGTATVGRDELARALGTGASA